MADILNIICCVFYQSDCDLVNVTYLSIQVHVIGDFGITLVIWYICMIVYRSILSSIGIGLKQSIPYMMDRVQSWVQFLGN